MTHPRHTLTTTYCPQQQRIATVHLGPSLDSTVGSPDTCQGCHAPLTRDTWQGVHVLDLLTPQVHCPVILAIVTRYPDHQGYERCDGCKRVIGTTTDIAAQATKASDARYTPPSSAPQPTPGENPYPHPCEARRITLSGCEGMF